MSLFMSELGMRATRAYFVARVGRNVVGYCGLMLTGDDGHITTIAVDPVWHRQQIGTRLLLALVNEARARESINLTLEVRVGNRGAQDLYRKFGFESVGVRKGYYAETNEDAMIMWSNGIDTAEFARHLGALERTICGATIVESPRRW